MKNNYNIILGMLLGISIVSFLLAIGIIIGRKIEQNNQSFPFTEVGEGLLPEPTSILEEFPSIIQVDILEDDEWTTNVFSIETIEWFDVLINLKQEFGKEYEIIMAAAARNACEGDNLLILFAIRKAENGPPGNEFGIEVQRGMGLNTQAGWAAATIMKNRERWNALKGYEELFGVQGFINFLGKRYCPLNSEVWIKNVTYWFKKLKGKENGY